MKLGYQAQAGQSSGRLPPLAEYILGYGGLIAFAVVTLSWSLVSSLLYRILPQRIITRIGPAMVTAVARTYIGILRRSGQVHFDFTALNTLRGQVVIIAPNHPSLLDAVMVIARLPGVVCITKAELWDNPLLGGGMRMAGYIRNDTPIALTKLGIAKLRESRPLLLFPEGTRTTRQPVNQFRGGFALMVKLAGVPIQTVFIETNSRFLGKGWPLLKKPDLPLVYRIRLGRRFEVEGDVRQFVATLEQYFRDELR